MVLSGTVICYSLLLNMTIEIVDFPINSMVDLSIVFCKRLPGRVNRPIPRARQQALPGACFGC